MKSYRLARLASLLLILTNVCCTKEDSLSNIISISACHYVEDSQMPSKCDSFFLSIDQMDNDVLVKRHYVGDVTTGTFYFLPPASGIYVIGVVDDLNRRDALEINYSGGSIALNLIIR